MEDRTQQEQEQTQVQGAKRIRRYCFGSTPKQQEATSYKRHGHEGNQNARADRQNPIGINRTKCIGVGLRMKAVRKALLNMKMSLDGTPIARSQCLPTPLP